MSQDPFKERESKKHIHSIPSREFIIKYLSNRKKPASFKEIIYALNIVEQIQIKALRRRLHAMKRDGQLICTRHRYYSIPECINLVTGIVMGHRNGFGFLRVKGYKDDLYLSSAQMKMCIHGDQVLAQPIETDRRGRQEARIVRILLQKTNRIIGRYFVNEGVGFVVPYDNRLSFDILIASDKIVNVRIGCMVVVELIKRPTRYTKAVGKIIEVLGDHMDTAMAVNIALRTHEIPYIWPKAVEEQVKKLKEKRIDISKSNRVDLRNLSMVTIDSEDARDFDDAVYCEKKDDGNWQLWVAIADVSHYVRTHTPLDHEALRRGTSIYFPSQVVPMLPEILSNDLCSLNPKVERLCMVCEMIISKEGYLVKYEFYEAVINSYARLTYTEVWHILQGNQELREKYASLTKHIEELYHLYRILNQAREKRGGISLESEETKFIFNIEQRIERIEQTHRNDAHKLIEECMILANISAACFVEKANEPALFRIHEKPTTEAIISFRSILSKLGLTLPNSNRLEPRDYANLLKSIAHRPDAEMLQTMLLRSMKQAIYDPKNRGHFGLALPSYAHFTSPIRRYPDLLLHRIIKYLLKKRKSIETEDLSSGWHYTMEEMLFLGQHCSMTERRADEATREVSDWLKCDFMLNQIGNTFQGVISSVTDFGFFVRLDELLIDGLVHVSHLNDSYYHFDQVGQCLISESIGKTYRLGDRIEVKVESVNMDERKINFCLIAKACVPYGVNKTKQQRKNQDNNLNIRKKQKHQINKKNYLKLRNKIFHNKTRKTFTKHRI